MVNRPTYEPIQSTDLTGWPEDVLYTIGAAHRRGQLVRYDEPITRPDGTVSTRVYYTGTLRFPAQPALDSGGTITTRWDPGDYVYAALWAGGIAIVGGSAWLGYLAVTWCVAHATTVLTVLGLVVGFPLLLALFTGRSGGSCCTLIHIRH